MRFFFSPSKLWELLVAGILLRINTAKTAMFEHDITLLMLQGDKNWEYRYVHPLRDSKVVGC